MRCTKKKATHTLGIFNRFIKNVQRNFLVLFKTNLEIDYDGPLQLMYYYYRSPEFYFPQNRCNVAYKVYFLLCGHSFTISLYLCNGTSYLFLFCSETNWWNVFQCYFNFFIFSKTLMWSTTARLSPYGLMPYIFLSFFFNISQINANVILFAPTSTVIRITHCL